MNYNDIRPSNAECPTLTMKGILIAIVTDNNWDQYAIIQGHDGNCAAIEVNLGSMDLTQVQPMVLSGYVAFTHVRVNKITNYVMWECTTTKESTTAIMAIAVDVLAPGIVVGTMEALLDEVLEKDLPPVNSPDGTARTVAMIMISLPYSWTQAPRLKTGSTTIWTAWFALEHLGAYVHFHENAFFTLSDLTMGTSVLMTYVDITYFTFASDHSHHPGERCISLKTTVASAIVDHSSIPSYLRPSLGCDDTQEEVSATPHVNQVDVLQGFTCVSVSPSPKKRRPSRSVEHVITHESTPTKKSAVSPSAKKLSPSPSVALHPAIHPAIHAIIAKHRVVIPNDEDFAPPIVAPQVVVRPAKQKISAPEEASPSPAKIAHVPNVVPRSKPVWGLVPQSVPAGTKVQFRDGAEIVDGVLTGGGPKLATLQFGAQLTPKKLSWTLLKLPP